jgi:FixJ family two-component response regulator
MSKPTVFVVDDDPSARRGVTRLLSAAGLVVESYPSARAFLDSGRSMGPGCIVLDVKMPDMTGPELQEELATAENCMPIIFLSAHGDVPTTAGTMKRGAVDFLTKPVDGPDLLKAIRTSLAMDAENRVQQNERSSVQGLIDSLSPREYEVLTYLITGMLNKQIAESLEISEETVKVHRGRVKQKLGVRSVPEMVRLCEKVGIAPAETRRT